MKKIYFAPKTELVFVETQQMMAGSLGSGEPNNFTPGDAPVTEDSNNNLSRRGSLWDEEE